MRLQPGDEFLDPCPERTRKGAPAPLDRPVYRVTGVVRETPWWGLYEAKKVFHNFHLGRRALEPTADDESLDVWLKTVHYERLDDREHVKARRELAEFEAQRVLGCRLTRRLPDAQQGDRQVGRPLSNLLPEPIDWLLVPNTRDSFAIPNARQLSLFEPVLVLEKVHGLPLRDWRDRRAPALLARLRLLADLLDFAAVMHHAGLILAGLGDEGVWVDELDRPHFVASDLTLDEARQQRWRPHFPPGRYPQGFAAPETFDPARPLARSSDLFAWAALARFLLGEEDPERVAATLRSLPGDQLPRVQGWFRAGARFTQGWPDAFVAALRACLEPDPARRPPSREALAERWGVAEPAAPREARCPACRLAVPAAELNEHLRRQHDYLEVGGELLAYGPGLLKLWGLLLDQHDAGAAGVLAELFAQRHGAAAPAAYQRALEAQLGFRRAAYGQPGTDEQLAPAWEALARCLGGQELSRRACVALLGHPDAALRLLARAAVVPEVAAGLALNRADARVALQAVAMLCPADGVDVRLAVCRRLRAAGAPVRALDAAVAELELDRTVACPVCGVALRQRDQAEHVRRQHPAPAAAPAGPRRLGHPPARPRAPGPAKGQPLRTAVVVALLLALAALVALLLRL